MKPHPPKDYEEEDPYLSYNDKPSPVPTVLSIIVGLLIFIAMAASNFFK